MINKDKWLNSLPKNNIEVTEEINRLDYDRWTNTISKKSRNYSVIKYTSIGTLIILGLLFVPVVKNKTRNLEKEINNLKASIYEIKYNLDQAILDKEVLTSPENISNLAKEHLDDNLFPYRRSQIKTLNNESNEVAKKINKTEDLENNKKVAKIQNSIKTKVIKEIEHKKVKIKKIYSNPKTIPKEIKSKVTKEIKQKKEKIKNLYESPKEVLSLERVQKWGTIQVVKVFLGIPVVPGR